nr:nuclear factor erythroid 2-related factor 3-like [Pan paniscus]
MVSDTISQVAVVVHTKGQPLREVRALGGPLHPPQPSGFVAGAQRGSWGCRRGSRAARRHRHVGQRSRRQPGCAVGAAGIPKQLGVAPGPAGKNEENEALRKEHEAGAPSSQHEENVSTQKNSLQSRTMKMKTNSR